MRASSKIVLKKTVHEKYARGTIQTLSILIFNNIQCSCETPSISAIQSSLKRQTGERVSSQKLALRILLYRHTDKAHLLQSY